VARACPARARQTGGWLTVSRATALGPARQGPAGLPFRGPPGKGQPGRALQAWARYARATQAVTTHVWARRRKRNRGPPSKGLQKIVYSTGIRLAGQGLAIIRGPLRGPNRFMAD